MSPDDAVDCGFGIHPLAQEFVFLDQANFFRHAAQKQTQFFEWRKRLGDVVVSAQPHGLHGSFDGAVSGHEGDFGARQKFLYSFEEFESRHVRHHHVTQDHVHRLLFEQGQRGFAAIRFETDEAQGFAHGHAELADALFIVDYQQPDTEFFFAESRIHRAFPIVFSTAEIRS